MCLLAVREGFKLNRIHTLSYIHIDLGNLALESSVLCRTSDSFKAMKCKSCPPTLLSPCRDLRA